MSRCWCRMVDVIRVLLGRTATLDAARTCNSSIEMWWERKNSDILAGGRGVDGELWGRGGGIAEELADELAAVVVLL